MSREQILTDILERRGSLTPRVVVEESRPKNAPLHAEIFDRPAKEAAERYYEIRAAQVIRSVHITKTSAVTGEPVRVRAFISVRQESVDGESDDPAASYVPVQTVADSPMLRAIVRDQMKREWQLLKKKYEAHEEFWAMVLDDQRAA